MGIIELLLIAVGLFMTVSSQNENKSVVELLDFVAEI